MNQTKCIAADYDGLLVSFTNDAWFNATAVAAKFGKLPNEWLRLPDTLRYRAALERKYGKIPHLRTARGRSGGTWLHPRLGVPFARWLDIDFAIWCDEQIDQIMRGHFVSEELRIGEYLPTYHELHDQVGLLASGSRNARFVHMNINKAINQAIGIGPGERGRLGIPRRSLLVVAQSLGRLAMANAKDHHDGYQLLKKALRNIEALRIS